jgi:hypothetical protein
MKQTLLRRGLLVTAIHVAIVASLGAKLVVDRATRPRGWARVAPYDPELPIRGRYVSLRVEAPVDGTLAGNEAQLGLDASRTQVGLAVRNQQITAVRPADSSGRWAIVSQRSGRQIAVLQEPIAYFIPEHAPDPSRRPAGEELWVEVTIPRRGGPRPIRLGVKKNGVLTPLAID